MFGAIIGDIVGSLYERKNIKHKNFELYTKYNRFTDDTVMTCAISRASLDYLNDNDYSNFKKNCVMYMQKYGRNYINAGYGGNFIKWILSGNPHPYNSYGNGSAMRVSTIGWIAKSLKEAEKLAEISASVTHNHIQGINGAKAIAGSVWLLLNGKSKEDIREYINKKYYELNFKIDDIRDNYEFDVSCQGSVPQAIEAFLESKDFEDALRISVSIGGDSDTIAAICGSLSEAFYGIPEEIKETAKMYLSNELLQDTDQFYITINRNNKMNRRSM